MAFAIQEETLGKWIVCVKFLEVNDPRGWGQGAGMFSLFCLACTFSITASATFKSFDGLNHIKNARSKLSLGHTCHKRGMNRIVTRSAEVGKKPNPTQKVLKNNRGKELFFVVFMCWSPHLWMGLTCEEFTKGKSKSCTWKGTTPGAGVMRAAWGPGLSLLSTQGTTGLGGSICQCLYQRSKSTATKILCVDVKWQSPLDSKKVEDKILWLKGVMLWKESNSVMLSQMKFWYQLSQLLWAASKAIVGRNEELITRAVVTRFQGWRVNK